jgi:hypothetical protein
METDIEFLTMVITAPSLSVLSRFERSSEIGVKETLDAER